MWSRSRCNYCVYIIYHHMISWYVNGMYHSCTVISVMVYLGESIFPQLPGTDLTLRLPGVRKPPMPMRQLRQPPKARCVAICCDLVVIPRVILLGKKCCGHTSPYCIILQYSFALRVSGGEVALRQGAAGQGATSQGASHALAAQEGSWC